jgi:hypothetical protein
MCEKPQSRYSVYRSRFEAGTFIVGLQVRLQATYSETQLQCSCDTRFCHTVIEDFRPKFVGTATLLQISGLDNRSRGPSQLYNRGFLSLIIWLVRFQMVSLEFFIDIILPIALWPWGLLSL